MAETTNSLNRVLKENYDDSRDQQRLPSRVIKRMMARGKRRGRDRKVVDQSGSF